ncbi:MAG TPA: undecaprenyldiphospho-muramoylpentapeptide beta-N-acetylglucosaminyltransferase [Balneolales bacterium]|nr:undecaprenyldiphospho-muramoylpentapeptide beta-N-acetylglucosaminyltransferase [Balneolales bacterium]
MSKSYRILIAAGGTGGHVFPAISIADALRDQNESVIIEFVGTKDKIEWKVVPEAGYPIHNIWISGFHRRLTMKNLLFPLKLFSSIIQSYQIIRKFSPDIVVACGGYVAGPIGWVASQKRIPLVLQEQNSFPGVTNRLLAKYALIIFTAFKQADRYFPDGKTKLLGNPVRKSLLQFDISEAYHHFGFSSDKPTLAVLGGSGGAKAINEAMRQTLDRLHDELHLQIIWQCGSRYAEETKQKIDESKYSNLRLMPFIDKMEDVYAISDLVISRAGAGSCAELMVTGKPAILVPSSNVAGDHQTKNAEAMVENGAAVMISDNELANKLFSTTDHLFNHKDQLNEMAEAAKSIAIPDASDKIASQIINLITKKESDNRETVTQ